MTCIADLLICLRFFSRLPLPTTQRERRLGAGGLAEAAAMAPLAGALLGLASAAVLVTSVALRLPAQLAAGFALATSILVTGALHEDALADCADGFGGGGDRASKLAIMRDSRIGAFGGCAIALSLFLRGEAIAAVASRHGMAAGGLAIVAAAATSRAWCLLPLALLPPARADGIGASSGVPSVATVVAATAGSTALAGVALLAAGLGRAPVGAAMLVPALATLFVCRLAFRQIGGQTGDVAGAVQQVVEIVLLASCAAC